ncbi:MAG: BMP family ABC transporter substrate-binding protein [Lachnospiraceae bacterium]|nr:BMP family ABC transporter substrate-binding protein [Lachnospiraceae bacterium]
MKKRILSIVLTTVLCMSMIGCAKKDKPAETPAASTGESSGEAAESSGVRVCVVYTGNLGDKSYNDSCNEGAQRAVAELGIELKSLEGVTAQEWEANLLAACEGGYDLIIGSSSNLEEYMKKHASNYPDTCFAIIDTVIEGDNIQSISFAQNQGSFLAGAAAAMFTEMTDIDGVNEDVIIGWVGGMDIPVLHDFYIGYEQGAKYVNPDIKILQSFAGTWNDPLKGKELTLAQFEQGADIVMGVASTTGTGILEGAKEAGKYAIGVDLNQDGDQPGSVLTSMVKRVDNACYLTIKSVVDGTFEGGKTQYLTLADGGVSLTDFAVIKEHLGDKFPQEIVDKCNELAEKIIAGEIVVENYEGFGPQ